MVSQSDTIVKQKRIGLARMAGPGKGYRADWLLGALAEQGCEKSYICHGWGETRRTIRQLLRDGASVIVLEKGHAADTLEEWQALALAAPGRFVSVDGVPAPYYYSLIEQRRTAQSELGTAVMTDRAENGEVTEEQEAAIEAAAARQDGYGRTVVYHKA